jgi:adenylosuccinate lyase
LGLTQITDKAIEAIRSNLVVSDEAFQVIAAEERIRRHDVMSAVFALEKDAPDAAGIIHIGATSCYGTFVFPDSQLGLNAANLRFQYVLMLIPLTGFPLSFLTVIGD